MDQVVQVLGALLVLLAFALAQVGVWRTDTWAYLWANLAGSAMLAVLAGLGRQWGFLLLEGVWALVSAASLLRRAGRRGWPADGRARRRG